MRGSLYVCVYHGALRLVGVGLETDITQGPDERNPKRRSSSGLENTQSLEAMDHAVHRGCDDCHGTEQTVFAIVQGLLELQAEVVRGNQSESPTRIDAVSTWVLVRAIYLVLEIC
jgi:hypothetical protein